MKNGRSSEEKAAVKYCPRRTGLASWSCVAASLLSEAGLGQ
jgi:hypothetical protein